MMNFYLGRFESGGADTRYGVIHVRIRIARVLLSFWDVYDFIRFDLFVGQNCPLFILVGHVLFRSTSLSAYLVVYLTRGDKGDIGMQANAKSLTVRSRIYRRRLQPKPNLKALAEICNAHIIIISLSSCILQILQVTRSPKMSLMCLPYSKKCWCFEPKNYLRDRKESAWIPVKKRTPRKTVHKSNRALHFLSWKT